jgi:hypothetical protein
MNRSKLYTVPDGTVINLDKVVAVTPKSDNYVKYYTIVLDHYSVKVYDAELPREQFIKVLQK